MTQLGPGLQGGFDNVGCFLIRAGFDAMVPGKHDFYYGPDGCRIWRAYLHLAKGTSILASNLVVVTQYRQAGPQPAVFTRPR